MEIFKPIGASTQYEVSDMGRVRNAKTGVIIKGGIGTSGYPTVGLRGDIGRTRMVHRMVAEAFLPNPDNRPQVNHKNGVKSDNRLDNLEWATQSENMQHCYDSGLKSYQPLHYKGKFGAEHNRSKAVLQTNQAGETLANYGSISEASRATGLGVSTIHWACNSGKVNRKTSTFFAYSPS